jgi:hypothetical protein
MLQQLPTVSVQRLFVATIILKIGLSILAWILGTRWALWTIGFALPLAIMGAYVVLGLYKRDPDEVSDEKFADSCYYLGFIFTITSIIIALFDIDKLGESGKLAEIAVRFGAAMVSTVAGLVVRVYLVNFKKDLADIARTMEDDLLEAGRTFRTHLNLATENLKDLNAKVHDASGIVVARLEVAIAENAKANAEELERLFGNVSHQIATAVKESNDDIRESSDQLKKSLQTYVVSLVASTKHHEDKLNDVSSKLEQQLVRFSTATVTSVNDLTRRLEAFTHALNDKLNAVEFPAELFKNQLAPSIEKLQGEIAAVTSSVGEYSNNLQAGITTLSGSLAEAPKAVAEATENIRKVVEEQSKTIDKVNVQEQAFLKLARNIKHFETALEKSTEGVARQVDLVSQLSGAVTAIAGDHESLRSYATEQSNALNSMNAQIHRLAEAMEVVSSRIVGLPQDNKAIVDAIHSSTSEYQTSLRDLVEQQRTSADMLFRQLDELRKTGELSKDGIQRLPEVSLQIVSAIQSTSAGQVRSMSDGLARLAEQLAISLDTLKNDIRVAPTETRQQFANSELSGQPNVPLT